MTISPPQGIVEATGTYVAVVGGFMAHLIDINWVTVLTCLVLLVRLAIDFPKVWRSWRAKK